MTATQYRTLVSLLHCLDEHLERVEQRLAWTFPTDQDMRDQIDAELHSILAPGAGISAFADD